MSLVCALSHPCLTLLATDERYSTIGADGAALDPDDRGGKLLRIDEDTWVSFGGYLTDLTPVLDTLAERAASFESAWGVLVDAVRELPTDRYNALFIAGARGVGAVSVNNILAPAEQLWHVGHPPDIDGSIAEEKAALAGELEHGEPRTARDVVRRVARFFARCAAASPFISPTMELGTGRYYVAGEAAAIAAMGDAELSAALRLTSPQTIGERLHA